MQALYLGAPRFTRLGRNVRIIEFLKLAGSHAKSTGRPRDWDAECAPADGGCPDAERGGSIAVARSKE